MPEGYEFSTILSIYRAVHFSVRDELREKRRYLLRSEYEQEYHFELHKLAETFLVLYVALVWFYRLKPHRYDGKCRHQDFKNKSTVRFTVKSSRCDSDPPTDDRCEAFRHQLLTTENRRN